MSRDDDVFRHDYDLDALVRVQPQEHDFQMVVTPRFRSRYVDRPHEPLTGNLIRSVAGRKRVFVDVGAHYGFFTLVAGLSNPALEIHAIEPLEENCEILSRNLELNGLSSVVCHQAAASNRTERSTLCRSRASDNSSFHPHPAAPPIAKIEVETLELATLLEDWVGAPILIKIDTDGHEIPVLEGLADVLSGNDDATLIVEINPEMQQRAGHDPADLLKQLERIELSSFLLREDGPRLIRVDSSSDWQDLIPANGTGKLYCRPQSTSLSVCFMAHSHSLAGAERAMVDLVTQLIEDHGTVCNVVIPGEGPLREQIVRAGAGVIPADYGWWCSREPKTSDDIEKTLGDDLVRVLARTLPEVEATQPDLVSSSSIVIPHGAVVAAALGKPHVWHLREYGTDYQFYLPATERSQFIEDFSEVIFTASRQLGERLFPHLDRDRIDFLYPSIQIPPSSEPTRPSEASSSSRPLLLVDLASVIEAKQQEIDVRAVAELTRRGHRVDLLLKGPQDPAYVKRLQELADSLGVSDRITFEEFSADIWPTLARADVVLVSFPAHCFGRVAAEGMLGARPVVYPASTDISEYMLDGVTGLAYVTGDPQDMADQVERIVLDPDLGPTIGKAANARASELFTRGGFGDKFVEHVRSLVPTGPGTRPPLPKLLIDSLVLGIQRLDRHSIELEELVRARDRELMAAEQALAGVDTLRSTIESKNDELDSIRPVLADKQEELDSIRPVLADKQEELDSIRPVLADKQEELDSIRPVLAAREEELANVKADLDLIRDRLQSLLSTRLGRLAAKLAKID